MWDANGDLLRRLVPGRSTSAATPRMRWTCPRLRHYYLQVAGDSGQRSIQPFSLHVDFTPATDGLEPNFNFGHAALIGLDRTVQANVPPATPTGSPST